jgi:lysophospholipase L1-like esterase
VVPLERFEPYAVLRHAQDLEHARAGDANVVFLGDSISDNWGDANRDGSGVAVWKERIAPLGAANFGVPGDTTANVLWRIRDGELAGKPKLVVLEIGTNDLAYGGSTTETVAGIHAVIDAVIEASPSSRILLMGILPRGEGSDDPLTRAAHAVNEQVAAWAGDRIHFLDIGAKFVNPDGTLDTSLFLDRLHPNAGGYEIWADALLPVVSSALVAPPPGASASTSDSSAPESDADSGLVLVAPPLDTDGPAPSGIMATGSGLAGHKDRSAWWR